MASIVTPTPFQPGFRLIDGSDLNFWLANLIATSQDAVTASTTQTRVGGTSIRAGVTRVTVAAASDAVTLAPPAQISAGGQAGVIQAGDMWIISNKTGQTIQVFPAGASDTIDGGAAGAAVNLSNGKLGFYICTAVNGGVATFVSGGMAVSS